MKISSPRSFRFSVLLLSTLLAGCAAPSSTQAAPGEALQSFALRDQLGRDWNNELVTYPVADHLFGRQDLTLVGPGEKAQVYQWTTAENGKKQIAFQADLPKFSQSTYRLQAGATSLKTDLSVEDSADAIRLSNSKTGIAIRKKLTAGQAPISAVKLNSGAWAGGSQVVGKLPVQSYEARVVERGPVFAEILATVDFGNGRMWRMRAHLEAGEPVVMLSEAFDAGADSSWRLQLHDNFSPTGAYSRDAKTRGELESWEIEKKDGRFFLLEPWLHWWMARQYNWLGLYNDNSDDMLVLGALEPGDWVNPEKLRAGVAQSRPEVPIVREGDGLYADFSLLGGVRKWMIGALPKGESLRPLLDDEVKNKIVAPLPQQYLIKHGDFPLNTIKDYTLNWKGDETGHPSLLVTPAHVARFRKTFQADEKVKQAIINAGRLNREDAIRYFLGTGDKEVGRLIADTAMAGIQGQVDAFLREDSHITLGSAPHHLAGLLSNLYLADTVWSEILTPAQRERLKAQIAFLGYTVNRPDFWSPARGFSANPNMTTMVAAYQTGFGAMIPAHPNAKTWIAAGLAELKSQLDNWSDANGGWIEAPHYAMASFDFIIGPFLMAHNAGLNDDLFDPQMQKVANWFAQISTPPDVNVEGIRHLPPIGNTYMNEPSGEFGLLAGLWKDKDPVFAGQMQWMFEQQGRPGQPGIGGAYPALAGYRDLLLDPDVRPIKPDYRSTLFPETGVMLRNGVDDRETQLHMIAGSNHAHYDNDSGSVTLWGKGRLIANDFGYNGAAPANQHNMIESPAAEGVMRVQTFHSTTQFDYVRGQAGGWIRQIAFVKDADMLAPNYFVLRDSLGAPVPATWRMFFTADKVTPGQSTLVEGKDDVDTDVIFVAPAHMQLKTEDKSVTVYGLNDKRRYGKVTTTQTGLIGDVKGQDILTVIFPRLKTQKPPVVTSLADGKAAKIVTEAGVDYVFLNDVPFDFNSDGIKFHGTAGVVKIRGGQAFVSLGEGGTISAMGQSDKGDMPGFIQTLLKSDGKTFYADFEDGSLLDFHKTALDPHIHAGNPVPGDHSTGKYSLALTVPASGASNVSCKKPILIDPERKYRLSVKVFLPQNSSLTVGGYGMTRQGVQYKKPDGNVWGWSVGAKGPMEGWKTLEATFGPEGSGAKFVWPPEVASTNLIFWAGGANAAIYLDDIVMEEVK